ncbi:hypothetical protein RND81_08G047200 [Saponaria officinalis]|uniref:Peptidase A1 domain-containing protein n=1 Tax=Saponaria officinalis TaxID=3572 RepID=A0AAW1J413_SAPOF
MKFYLGTPPRPVYGGFDTGSELVWFHCKENPTSVTNMSTFDQFKSSTYRMISCKDEYMCDTHTSVGIRCRSKSCEFVTEYVDDTHVEGVMGYDLALTNPYGESLAIPDLMFGCNTNNPTRDKVGLIGGGNGKYSFPKQISLFDPKFSYCISNDVTKTYEIKFGKEATLTGNATQVLKNNNTPFYYLNVIGIKVNGKHIFVSSTEFQMSSDGSKGFIIDSGATLSYLSPKVFDGVKYELEQQLGPPQKYWIYDICYPLSRFPKMKVRFKPRITIVFSESELELPIIGTWQWEPRFELLCLLIRRTDDLTSTLGLTQLWDVNVGHDPVNNMLYLSKTDCPTHDL